MIRIAKQPKRLASFLSMNSNSDCIVQLGGSCPDKMAQSALLFHEQTGQLLFNINCGCPSDRVAQGSFGAVLMRTPEFSCLLMHRKIAEIACEMKEKVPLSTISIKSRIGVDDDDSLEFLYNFIHTIHIKANVKHFIIHARKALLDGLSPAENRTIPPINYQRVYEIAKLFPTLHFTINGEIKNKESIASHLKSNVSSVMIGRAIYQRPLLFADDEFINPINVAHEYLAYLQELEKMEFQPSKSILLSPMMALFSGRPLSGHFKQLLSKNMTSRKYTAVECLASALDTLDRINKKLAFSF